MGFVNRKSEIENWKLEFAHSKCFQLANACFATIQTQIKQKISTGGGLAGIFVHTAYVMFGPCLRRDFYSTCSFHVSVFEGDSGNVFAFLVSFSKRPYNLRFRVGLKAYFVGRCWGVSSVILRFRIGFEACFGGFVKAPRPNNA